jgi:hypothetical protein
MPSCIQLLQLPRNVTKGTLRTLMPAFLTSAQASRLRGMVRPYLVKDRPRKSWENRTDDELWRRVLSQIVVVGRAEPGHRLQHDPAISRQLSIRRLRTFQRDAELQRHLHDVFVRIGVRYTGKNWRSNKKAAAGTKNFVPS